MRTPAQRVIARAQIYIGMHEEPLGSNSGPFVKKCQSFTWLPGTGWPWCVAFCQRVFAECGLKLPWGSAGAWDLYGLALKAGWTTQKPAPGYIAIWNIGSGHASIVRRVLGNEVETIDGNVSDKVSVCIRPIKEARGFIRHPQLAAKPKPKLLPEDKIKKPVAEVVGSASGKSVIVYSSRLRAILARTGIGSFTIPANQERWKVNQVDPPTKDRKKT
jgi:hypothetical protein